MRNFLLSLLLVGSCYGATVFQTQNEIPPDIIEISGTEFPYINDTFYINRSLAFVTRYTNDYGEVPENAVTVSKSSDDIWYLLADGLEYQNNTLNSYPPSTGWYDYYNGTNLINMVIRSVEKTFATYPQPSTNGVPSVDLSGFDEQSYPFSGEVWDGTITFRPQIAEHTRQAAPGDTIALTGWWLNSDTKFIVSDDSGDTFVVDPLVLAGESQAAITMTNALDPNEMYMCWPSNSHTVGQPFAINKTEAWWIGPDNVESGKTFSVYGRNLNLDGTNTYLYIEENSSWITNSSGNPYKADFVADLAPGTYTVWAHNGKGREYGWSDSLSLTVRTPDGWSDDTNNWICVTNEAYGAIPDDGIDDLSAINAAINSADSEAWSTIYFPSGVYEYSDKVSDSTTTKVRFIGDAGTVIQPHSSNLDETFYSGTMQDCEFNNITFKANEYGGYETLVFESSSDRIKLLTVKVDQYDAAEYFDSEFNGYQYYPIQFKGQHLEISNCTFTICAPISIFRGSNVIIQDTSFIGTHSARRLLAPYSWDASGISVFNCTVSNYNDSAEETEMASWCAGRFVHGTSGPRNMYFGDNSLVKMAPSTWHITNIDANQGEHIMFEFDDIFYNGGILSSTSNSVSISSDPSADIVDACILITKGKGIGQYRRVSSYSNRSIVLDKPWTVVPDPDSSIISIGEYVTHLVVFNNEQSGRTHVISNASPHIASAGFEPYGGMLGCVVQSNSYSDLRFGIANYGLDDTFGVTEYSRPVWFNLFSQNTFSNTRNAVRHRISASATTRDYVDFFSFNTYSKNNFDGNVSYVLSLDTTQQYQNNGLTVWDSCTFTNYSDILYGFDGPRAGEQVWIGNTTNGVSWNP